jgi:hypothetical protein
MREFRETYDPDFDDPAAELDRITEAELKKRANSPETENVGYYRRARNIFAGLALATAAAFGVEKEVAHFMPEGVQIADVALTGINSFIAVRCEQARSYSNSELSAPGRW